MQSIFKLKHGEGLRLTTAHYYTPSGVSIHEKGIAPQVEVVVSAEDDAKLRQQAQRPDVTDPREFERRFGFAPVQDRQLQAALDVLKGVELLDDQKAKAGGANAVSLRTARGARAEPWVRLVRRPPRPAADREVRFSGWPRPGRA